MSLFVFEEAVKEMAHLKGCPASKQGKDAQAKAFLAAVASMGEFSEAMVESAGKHFARHGEFFPKTADFAAKVHQVQTTGGVLAPVWIVYDFQPCACSREYAGRNGYEVYADWYEADKAAQEMWAAKFPEQAEAVAQGIARHKRRKMGVPVGQASA